MRDWKEINWDGRKHEFVQFGVYDGKGREVGAHVMVTTGVLVSGESALFMRFSATRGGADFGPIQPWRGFKTEADRDAAKAKYLDGARKRSAKLAGK